MGDVVLAVQKAIVAALAGMTAVSDGGGSVAAPLYDAVPDDAAMPFVAIADITARADDTLDDLQSRIFVYLEIASRYRGRRQVLDIASTIHSRLHDVALPLDDGTSLLCRVTDRRAVREPDAITYQGAVTIAVTAAH